MAIVSISIPAGLRARLDAEARRQRRSRSYVVAQAIEEYLAHRREAAEFGSARGRTLRDGLALSPADRVRLSEELWRELTRGRRRGKPWTAVFETFDQYERWRRKRGRVA
jgi:predicted transcriptional regulator